MTITSRQYAGDGDLRAMLQLVSHLTDHTHSAGWHHGDVLWGIYANMIFDPRRNIRLWEDTRGALCGFAWLDEAGWLAICSDPRTGGAEDVTLAMLAWADERGRERALEAGAEVRAPDVQALESEAALAHLLTGCGYTPEGEVRVYMRQALGRALPEPALPVGWTVRQVGGEEEWQERVAAHRDVWPRSRMTLDAYRRLRSVPEYAHDLDLAAVSPEGTIAAYTIVWYDAGTASGQFEPVGTRPAFRQRGLGRAVLLEGLRRLMARGARTAIVNTNEGNAAARALYTSVGFRVHDRFLTYARKP